MPEPKWIRFEEHSRPGAATRQWVVVSKSQGSPLGVVKWGLWRRYCFYPLADCLFDATCLGDVARFLDEQTRQHRSPALIGRIGTVSSHAERRAL